MINRTIYRCTLLPALLGLVAVCWLGGCRKLIRTEEVFFEFEMPYTVSPATGAVLSGTGGR